MSLVIRNRAVLWATVVAATAVSARAADTVAEESWQLEEVLVTAQRRVETLQNAPLSVTAFSGETIRELGILDIEEISRYSPNVTIHKVPAGSANATVRIRGLANSEVIITTDPKVTMYLDGVLIAKAAGSLLDLVDLERIEVLRGPQGTLFGRNAVGGAISVFSKEPVNDWDFSQSFDAGNYDYFESQTMVNAPIMDSEAGTLAARGVYMYRNLDGWVENESGDDWGEEDRKAGRLSLAWARENWSARYVYDFSDWSDTIPAPFLEAVGDFDPDTLTPKNPGLSQLFPQKFGEALAALGREEDEFADFIQLDRDDEVPSEFIGDHNLDVDGHSVTLEGDFSDRLLPGDLTFRSITAYRETDRDSIGELDGTPVAISYFDTADENMEQFTQEFQFIGNTYDERLDYVLGLYWFDEDGDLDSYNRTLDFTVTGDPDPLNEIYTTVGVDNDAWAVYGQTTLADIFTERLSLTLGLRYTDETRGMSMSKQEFRVGALQTGGCDPSAPGFDPTGCLSFDIDEDKDYDNVSWETNLRYLWTDDLMSYLRVSTGYQSGGFNGRASTLDAAIVPFDEEESLQYELGVKSKLWRQRINVALAFFYTETDDLQLPVFPPDSDSPNVGTVVENAGESDSYGAELEVQALLTPDLETYFNFAWFEGDYDEYIIGSDDLDGDGVRETPVDVADVNKFIQQPQYTAGLGARYSFGDTGFGDLWARADASWRDDNLFAGGGAVQTVNAPELDRESAYARPLNQQDAYWLVDAMVTLENIPLVEEGNLRVSLWGRNLTDEEYRYTSVDLLEFLGLGVTHYGDPRTYGVTISYNFR